MFGTTQSAIRGAAGPFEQWARLDRRKSEELSIHRDAPPSAADVQLEVQCGGLARSENFTPVDREFFTFSPIKARPLFKWPGGARDRTLGGAEHRTL